MIEKIKGFIGSRKEKTKQKIKERRDRCTLDRIWYDYENECYRRFRDKDFKKSELPMNAVPVTGMRNTFAIVSLDAPPMAPHGQDAVVLYVWSEDYSFERSFEHFSSSDDPPLDWKKIIMVVGVIIVGIYVLMASGLLGK